jgi:hypothetical protein
MKLLRRRSIRLYINWHQSKQQADNFSSLGLIGPKVAMERPAMGGFAF